MAIQSTEGAEPYDLTVVIPTFNEKENIGPMIRAVHEICTEHKIFEEILVVDDDSPDGTAGIVRSLQESMNNLELLVRHSNHGLSPSLYDGILAAGAPLVQCIDCDFSHPPEKIPRFYRCLRENGCDMVIGSRYVRGGEVRNWAFHREILSFGAATLGRVLIPHVHDSGSGFFAIKKAILDEVTLTPRGFRMGFEILGKAGWARVAEIPITFKDREMGESKLRWRILLQYLVQCLSILEYNLVQRRSNAIARSWRIYLAREVPERC
ncbi:dolichol-phosphate mannosyltransferase [Methanolinea mesophila]|uniref:polyprenol monophosphomannose synthase n=1 Tax=Methanolinea mesophila TaxID=547055 RepID=UPI003158A920|nr:dolichol-phosphate mannosyltransferase [Methanolinea mesophila]